MSAENVTAVAALVTGLGSCLMAWAALVSSRRKANEECEGRLRDARREAEQASDELHAQRMRRA